MSQKKSKVVDSLVASWICDRVRSGDGYSGIPLQAIQQELNQWITEHGIPDIFLEAPKTHFEKNAIVRSVVKEIRTRLRRQVGAFEDTLEFSQKELEKLVSEIQCNPFSEVSRAAARALLDRHASTRERLEHLNLFLQQWSGIATKKTSVVDLGSGIDPLLLLWSESLPAQYDAYDLSESSIQLASTVLSTLEKKGLMKGTASVLDLTKALPSFTVSYDVGFMFKLADLLDHKRIEEVLSSGLASLWIVSFSTITLTGRPMSAPRRSWITKLCRRKGWTYRISEIPGELFYHIQVAESSGDKK